MHAYGTYIYSTYICIILQVLECHIHHIYVVHLLHLVYAVNILHCICGGIFLLNQLLDMRLIIWLYMFLDVLSYHYFIFVHHSFHVLN
jgi:hypothetical protein